MAVYIRGIGIVVIKIPSGNQLCCKIGMCAVNTRIQTGNGYTSAQSVVPGQRCADFRQVPGVWIVGIVRDIGRRFEIVEFHELKMRMVRESCDYAFLCIFGQLDNIQIALADFSGLAVMFFQDISECLGRQTCSRHNQNTPSGPFF